MRLIDADELEKIYMRNSITDTVTVGEKTVLQNLRAAPTIDAVEVVRCGLCRYCDTKDCVMSGTPGSVSVSDFCSYGERRDDNA